MNKKLKTGLLWCVFAFIVIMVSLTITILLQFYSNGINNTNFFQWWLLVGVFVLLIIFGGWYMIPRKEKKLKPGDSKP